MLMSALYFIAYYVFEIFLVAERDSRTLFVKNLPKTVTEKQLKKVFAKATDIRIRMSNKKNVKNPM